MIACSGEQNLLNRVDKVLDNNYKHVVYASLSAPSNALILQVSNRRKSGNNAPHATSYKVASGMPACIVAVCTPEALE